MEIDIIIKELNEKITSQSVSLEKLRYNDFTEIERTFIEKYKPGKYFVIYGTLAPKRPNHSKIEHINGKWMKGIVKGKLTNEGWGAELGYFGFKHSHIDEQDKIEAHILFSEEIVDNWLYLDEFEGNGYIRILTKFELENGEVGVGNIYAINNIEP
jgi:gamma-glutamylcyclotransferase (GGCT)/AIG2-like uncharacterized protein YtfP